MEMKVDYEAKLIECEKQALQDIFSNLMRDEKLASEIVTEMSGELVDSVGIPLIQAALRGDAAGLLDKFTSLIYKAAKVQAEYKAIAMADAWSENEEREYAERKSAMFY
jgi:DNA polymerase III gamma/tau subunit